MWNYLFVLTNEDSSTDVVDKAESHQLFKDGQLIVDLVNISINEHGMQYEI